MSSLNISTSHRSNFRLVFPFMPFLGTNEKADSILLYLKEVTLPEVELEVTDIPTQFMDFKTASNKLKYGNLTVSFAISELFINYKFIYNWMMAIKDPELWPVINRQVEATLHVLSNMKNPKLTIELFDLFPISLSSLDFKYTTEDANDLTAEATFAFNYYKIT